jgi:hypothetical protein
VSRDYSLQSCFATALSLGLLRDRSLVLGCFATVSCPGLLRDRLLFGVASRPSPVRGCFTTASCPGLLHDHSRVFRPGFASRPLSLEWLHDPPFFSKLQASQLCSYIYPITTQTTPTPYGPASLAPCFEVVYSLSWPLSSMIGLLPRWARTIVVNNAGPAKI